MQLSGASRASAPWPLPARGQTLWASGASAQPTLTTSMTWTSKATQYWHCRRRQLPIRSAKKPYKTEGTPVGPPYPPATAAIPAALAMHAATYRRQRRAAAASRRSAASVAAALAASATALAAGFSGSHEGTFGAPGMGGDTSPSALAPHTLLGAESWADLMDADDEAPEKAAGRDSVTPSPGMDIASFWDSHRTADGAIAGASRVLGAGGDASASHQGPILNLRASHQGASGAAYGAVGASGAREGASSSPPGANCDTLCSRLAVCGAVVRAPGAPRAGGDTSPSQGAISDFSGSHQAACGAVAGTVGAPRTGRDASPSPKGVVSVGVERPAAPRRPLRRPVADPPPPTWRASIRP